MRAEPWDINKPQPQEWKSDWRLEQERRRAEECTVRPRCAMTAKPEPNPIEPVVKAPRKRIRPKRAPKPKVERHCSKCRIVQLACNNRSGLCKTCYVDVKQEKMYGSRSTCFQCGKDLRRGVKSGLCKKDRQAKWHRDRKAKV